MLTQETRVIHGYRLIRLLGEGTFGEVWEARTAPPGNLRVAVKVISRLQGRAAEIELRSVEAIRDLSHPRILSIHDVRVDAEQVLIAMELAAGNLRQRLEYCQRHLHLMGIEPQELLHYLREVADGLEYLRRKGKIHRDVKPDNLLLFEGEPPFVKIGDCGLVRDQKAASESRTPLGTPAYIPPEVHNGGEWDFRGDQFSLAVTYLELRQGLVPFKKTAESSVADLIRHADPVFLDGVEYEERNVLRRALAKRPEQRYPTCLALIEALEQSLGIEPHRFHPLEEIRLEVQPTGGGSGPRIAVGGGKSSASSPKPIGLTPRETKVAEPPYGRQQKTSRGDVSAAQLTPEDFQRLEEARRKHQRPLFPPWVRTVCGVLVLFGLSAILWFALSFWLAGTVTVGLAEPCWVAAGDRTSLLFVVDPPERADMVLLRLSPCEGLKFSEPISREGRIEVQVVASSIAPVGKVRVAFNARLAMREGRVPRLMVQGTGTGRESTFLDISVLPAGCRPTAEGLPDDGKQAFCARIFCVKQGKPAENEVVPTEKVYFREIAPRKEGQPGPFYLMENKVTNGLYRLFVEENAGPNLGSEWARGGLADGEDVGTGNGFHPVFRVTRPEAAAFARWLGGALPTAAQLDRAAGLDEPGSRAGPANGPRVAVDRRMTGPVPVGDPTDDVTPEGIRHLAGNGKEWTRDNLLAGGDLVAVLRGQSYSANRPLLFADLLRMGKGNTTHVQHPNIPSPYTSFRVVIEQTVGGK